MGDILQALAIPAISYLPTLRPESLPGTRYRFLQPQRPKQQILQRQQRQENRIAKISCARHDRSHQRIHPIMVRRSHNRDQYHTGVSQAHTAVKDFPPPPLAAFPLFQRSAEYAGGIDHGAADDEGIAEMHGWHCGEGIYEIAAHPDGGCVIVADRVYELVFRWEEPGWHAWIEGEC